MYHVVVEALLAQPGQHFISDYLEQRELLPGFREGMRQVALDEQRHIGFGVKLLYDLRAEPGVVDAVADLIRRVTPYSLAVFIPPNWDRSYTECFGFTLEEIYTEGARSFEQKLRSAGMPLESLPGPSVFPLEMTPRERAEYGLAMLQAGFIGPPNGEPPRDPASLELLMTSVARAIDTRTAPAGPFTVQWEFADAEPWHVRVDNGSTAAGAGPRAARRPRAALPLRGLRRRRRRPPGPAPRAGHAQAAPARLAARAVGRAYALRVTARSVCASCSSEAGVDLERPRAADVEATWGVWERFAPARRCAPTGERTAAGSSRSASRRAGLGCTFAFEPSQGLRPVEDGEAELDRVPRGPARAARASPPCAGSTPAALRVGRH